VTDTVTGSVGQDPFATVSALRGAGAVSYVPQFGGWLVTGYDEIAQALKDPRLTAARMVSQLDQLPDEQRTELEALRTSIAMWMGHTNHADHVRMQRVIKRYFTPRTVQELRPRAQEITDELLDAVLDSGACEIIEDLARPLPARVIADMLGVPEKDRDLLPRWSQTISAVFGPVDLPSLRRSQQSIVEMSQYMRPIVRSRREQPADDLISMLVAAQEQGTVASEEEILANCVLLLFAGHETTLNLISNGLYLLLTHPDQLAQLQASPQLLPDAIEEMLRYAGPASVTTRFALEPLQLADADIEAGQLVYLALAAGNRDPGQVDEPDRFDITRPPMRHLAFGQGTFYCLGAALARMEADVCFSTLFRRITDLRLAPAGATWEARPPMQMSLTALPVTFTAR
jgi:cytochrome P450